MIFVTIFFFLTSVSDAFICFVWWKFRPGGGAGLFRLYLFPCFLLACLELDSLTSAALMILGPNGVLIQRRGSNHGFNLAWLRIFFKKEKIYISTGKQTYISNFWTMHFTSSDYIYPMNVCLLELLMAVNFLVFAVKLPELLAYVNIEEETLTRLQQKLLDFLKYQLHPCTICSIF